MKRGEGESNDSTSRPARRNWKSIALGLGAVASGVAIVVVADSQGWLDGARSSERAPEPLLAAPGVGADETPAMQLVHQSDAFVPRAWRAPSVSCATQEHIVQFASGEVARKAGLQVARVERRPMNHWLECNAEIVFNAERLAHVAPRAAGVVEHVQTKLGNTVNAGD